MQAKKTKRSSSRRHAQCRIKHDLVADLEAELLRLVRADQSMSRVELARQLKLAPSTAGIYVDRLIADGFLLEKQKVTRDFGRPPKALGLNPDGGRFIGVDFEARNLMATAVDFSQTPLKQYRDTIAPGESVETILRKIENAILKTSADDERKILGIGIGVPGSIDPAKGVAVHYRHIPGWDNIPLVQRVASRFAVPVFVENNIRSMALAELWFGQGRGIKNFICIGIRSGIAAGIIVDGHLYRGAQDLAGEIADWPCAMGEPGQNPVSLEDVASMRAIKNGPSAQTAARGLALVLAQLNLAFNPEKIILAGAVTMVGESFLEEIKRRLAEFCPPSEVPLIVNSALGDFNGALGAAALAVHQWKPVRN